jgi:hypothetical protein
VDRRERDARRPPGNLLARNDEARSAVPAGPTRRPIGGYMPASAGRRETRSDRRR